MSNQELNTDNCTSISPECPIEETIYGYYPSLGANSWGVAFFGLCCLINIALGWRFKTWTYMIAMVLATFTSSLGYVGRIIMHNNPWNEPGFMLQIILLTFSPAFNSAAIVRGPLNQFVSCRRLTTVIAVPNTQTRNTHILRHLLPHPTPLLPLGFHLRRRPRPPPAIRRRRHRRLF
jgi:hypothetical protein